MQQIFGVLLVIAGIAYFSFQGFTYTSHERVLDIGPLHASADQQKQLIPYSPGVGAAIIGGGVFLLLLSLKKKN